MKRQQIAVALAAITLLGVVIWQLVTRAPQNAPVDPETLIEQAREDLESGSASSAIEKLERAVQEIDTADTHYELGNAYAKAERFPEAEAQFASALALDPEHLDARANLAVVRYHLGDLAGAETEIRQVLDLQPSDAELHYNLGGILLAQDRLQEAEAEFLTAGELDPTLPETYLGLGRLYQVQGRVSEAAEALRKYISIAEDPVWRAEAEVLLEEIEQP